jgi:hypothetical protein
VNARSRSLLAALAVGTVVLTACGSSAPPAKELAIEVIETLEVTDTVKACMTAKVNEFEGEQLDSIAEAAEGGDQDAIAQLDEFQDALESCNAAG